jgi:hypothetical protein
MLNREKRLRKKIVDWNRLIKESKAIGKDLLSRV